jgi:hypothetical protein
MSAAWESMVLSTSHIDTISTGATCTNRNRSALPYQPQPIKPTRRGLSWAKAKLAAAAGKKMAAVMGTSLSILIHIYPDVTRTISAAGETACPTLVAVQQFAKPGAFQCPTISRGEMTIQNISNRHATPIAEVRANSTATLKSPMLVIRGSICYGKRRSDH